MINYPREESSDEGTRLHQEMERRRAQLKSDIQLAIDEAERGEIMPLDVEELKAELIAELDENGRAKELTPRVIRNVKA
jgi:hypothetical protein